MNATTRKQSKSAGKRGVRLIDPRTVLVSEPDGTGDLYDIEPFRDGWIFTKIDAEGERVPGSDSYEVRCEPQTSCSCRGWNYGYRCKHVACLTALLNARKLTSPVAMRTPEDEHLGAPAA